MCWHILLPHDLARSVRYVYVFCVMLALKVLLIAVVRFRQCWCSLARRRFCCFVFLFAGDLAFAMFLGSKVRGTGMIIVR